MEINCENYNSQLYSKYDELIGSDYGFSVSEKVFDLRKLVLEKGLPIIVEKIDELRSNVWKILLGVSFYNVDDYSMKSESVNLTF
jgi:hypothetical protein